MPFFSIKKRTKRYNVSSKSSFIVAVYLLDNTVIECTLSAESTGKECLENVCQRIELNETEYFGLKYVNKKLKHQWIELDKPLKKTLDKYANKPQLLYFGVMFYVPNAHKIQDEMTRYQYYLQLKSDVIDGKLKCSPEQAVLLAGYSVQAEFGDYCYERHTKEHLNQFVLLPMNLANDDDNLSHLTQEVMNAHSSLAGISSSMAELQYIIESQQLEGYGLEYYPAKDDTGAELQFGASFLGIFVKHSNNQPTVYFKWADINNLVHNKRMFGIESSLSPKTVMFQMDDPDMAKYVYKMCCLQHKFYRTGKIDTSEDIKETSLEDGSLGPIPDIQQTAQGAVESPKGQDQPQVLPQTPEQVSQWTVTEGHQAATTPEEIQGNYSNFTPVTVNQEQQYQQHLMQQTQNLHHQGEYQYANGQVYSMVPPELQQQPGLQQPIQSQQVVATSSLQTPTSAIMSRVSALPAYRPSPDYEAVMAQRIHQHDMEQYNNVANLSNINNIGNAQVYTHPEIMAYSQPEIGQAYPSVRHYLHLQQIQQRQYPVYPSPYGDSHPSHHGSYRPVDRTSSLIIQPTYISTPELHRQGLPPHMSTSENRISEALYNHLHKPPPPYPRPSSSTPDLASQTMNRSRSNASDSPDLVSRKNLNFAALSRFDQSVENLSADTRHLHLSQQLAAQRVGLLDDSLSNHSDSIYRLKDTASSPDIQAASSQVHVDRNSLPSNEILLTAQFMNMYSTTIDSSLQQPQQAAPITTRPVSQAGYSHLQYAQTNGGMATAYAPQNPTRVLPTYEDFVANSQAAKVSQQGHILPNPHESDIPPLQHSHYSPVLPPRTTGYTTEPSPDSELHHYQNLPPAINTLVGVENPNLITQNSDSEVIDCVDTTKSLSDQDSLHQDPNHSKTNSYDSNTLIQDRDSLPNSAPEDSPISQTVAASPSAVSIHSLTEQSPKDDAVEKKQVFEAEDESDKRLSMGPLKLAAMNGLALSPGTVLEPEKPQETETRAPKDERRKMLENKLEEGQLFKEFEDIPKKRTKADVAISIQPGNRDRNRFKDVHPYDENRVRLTPYKENASGYVNASHIKLNISKEKDWWFISAQGPLPNTVNDFWQMVWEQKIDVIAMLTGLEEHGKQKCHRYWPENPGPKNKMKFGDFHVTMQFSNNSGCYVTRGLTLKHKPSGKERLVWHLQYTDWPDHGCPEDIHGFIAYLDEIDSVQRHVDMERGETTKNPIVVHCSAGVGRSGVVILSQVLKACLEQNEKADIPAVLRKMREQRMFMVQTVTQYSFVYKTLIQYLKNSRLI